MHRIFPLKRGLYEDYVANAWCASSLFIKWKAWMQPHTLTRLSAAATLLAALPAMVQQVSSPTPRGLLYAMANSAFAFFMFAYQVRTAHGRWLRLHVISPSPAQPSPAHDDALIVKPHPTVHPFAALLACLAPGPREVNPAATAPRDAAGGI